ncbi:MFS transporter [Kribbella sp. NPDC055071]
MPGTTHDPVTATITSATDPPTPLPRLIGAILASQIGALTGLLTPLTLLLTLQLTRISGDGAAAAFGLVSGLGALFALFANPLAGRISDRTSARFGRRRTWILTGGISGALVLFALAFTTEVWQVAAVWCAVQTLFNFQQAATSALLADQVPVNRRGTVSGLIGAATLSIPVALAIVSAISVPAFQWAAVATGSAILAVVATVLIRDPQPSGAATRPRLGLVELLKSFWLNPRRHPAFGWAWVVRFLLTCGFASGTYNAFLLMDRFGFSSDDVGAQISLLSLVSIGLLGTAAIAGGLLSDRFGRQKPFVILGGVLAAAGLCVLALAPTLTVVYLATIVLGLGSGIFLAVDTALCVRMLPAGENAAKDLAIINMANTLPQSVVPFIAPFLLHLGGFTALYLTLAGFCVLGAATVLRLPELGREGDPRWALITKY